MDRDGVFDGDVREDTVPTLRRVASDERWDAVLLALPVSAESLPVVRAIAPQTNTGEALTPLRLAAVVCAVDVRAFEDDLLGDDLLTERGLALTADDRRAVGEALAAQVAHADVVVVAAGPPAVASAVAACSGCRRDRTRCARGPAAAAS